MAADIITQTELIGVCARKIGLGILLIKIYYALLYFNDVSSRKSVVGNECWRLFFIPQFDYLITASRDKILLRPEFRIIFQASKLPFKFG